MRFKRNLLLFLLTLTIFLAGCGGEATEELTTDDAVLTLAVGTMVSGFFETQTAMVTPAPPSTNTPLPTNTFLPPPTQAVNTLPPAPVWTPTFGFLYTFTPGTPAPIVVSGTPSTATPDPGALGYGCNNSIFIRDVNYPSGTTVSPGEEFVKTWKVKNTGTCEWQYNYGMAIVVDNDFDSSWNPLGRNVQPGQWAEVSVIVTAPKHDGTFTGYWRMADAGGNPFGATLALTVVVP